MKSCGDMVFVIWPLERRELFLKLNVQIERFAPHLNLFDIFCVIFFVFRQICSGSAKSFLGLNLTCSALPHLRKRLVRITLSSHYEIEKNQLLSKNWKKKCTSNVHQMFPESLWYFCFFLKYWFLYLNLISHHKTNIKFNISLI